MFSVSDSVSSCVSLFKSLKVWDNPFYNIAFSFGILKIKKNTIKCELRIYNLNDKMKIIGLKSKNININIPDSNKKLKKSNWNTSVKKSETKNLNNSWVDLPPYANKKKYTKILFYIKAERWSWIKFYDYKSRKSLKVWFKKKNNKWNYKVGTFNSYIKAKFY